MQTSRVKQQLSRLPVQEVEEAVFACRNGAAPGIDVIAAPMRCPHRRPALTGPFGNW